MRASGLVVALVALAQCAGASRGVSIPSPLVDPPPNARTRAPIEGPDARALIDRATAYEVATGDLSAQVLVEVRDGESGRGFSGRGAIAVHRPDRVRMQVSGPTGVTAIDLLARGDAFWSRTAGREWVTGHVSDAPTRGFPAATVARVFLGFDWAHGAVIALGDRSVVRLPSTEGFVLATVDRSDGALLEARWFDADGERARIRFERFDTLLTGVRFPSDVRFYQRVPAAEAHFTVDHRVTSPELPEQTFAVPL